MFKFNKEIESIFKAVAQNACDMGISAYFVGGMVRDVLMGIEIKDIDILIEGSAIDFVQKFADKFTNLDIVIKSVHEAFDTAKTVINGIEIDFASTREEDYPFSGCLPVVKNIGCPVEEDLKRRDFAVNAIAAKLCLQNDELNYEIIDPYNGNGDIKQKTLRILHNKSYIDDPTRILRGIDFMLRFGFDFSDGDKTLINEYLKFPDREGLSLDRVKLTLKKLFSGANAKDAYKYILENKICKIWCDKPLFKAEWADTLFDAAKIFDIPQDEIFLKAIFESSALQNESAKCPIGTSNFEIYNTYKNLKIIDLALQYAIFNDKNAVFYYEKLKDIKPDITGADLIKQGYTEGKAIGDELSRLLKEKLNSVPRS